MSRYELEQRVISCNVNVDLIMRLESYIRKKAEAIDNTDEEQWSARYGLTISDSVGSESLSSIKEYQRALFPDNIRSVGMSYQSYSQSTLHTLRVRLSESGYSSTVSVCIVGENARETATGIVHELVNAINDTRNLNYLFHGSWAAVPCALFGLACGILFGGTSTGMIVSKDELLSHILSSSQLAFVPFICALIWLCLRELSPYCQFESRRNINRQGLLRWLSLGILGALIFGGIKQLVW